MDMLVTDGIVLSGTGAGRPLRRCRDGRLARAVEGPAESPAGWGETFL